VRSLPALSLPAAAAVRENAGTVAVPVTLATPDGCPTNADVTVAYASADGTARAGSDYTAIAGSLTFPVGSASGSTQTLSLSIVNDTFVEPTKTFKVVLTSPRNAGLGTASETITILDNDTPAVSFVSDVTVSEGAGSAVVRAKVTTEDGNALHGAVAVRFATANGTAVTPSDYTAASGVLTFAAEAPSGTTQPVSVHVVDDTLAENSEYFTVGLSGPAGAVLGTPSKARVNVLDNEPTVGFSLPASAFGEGAGSATVLVTVTTADGQPSPNSVSVHYATANGTAQAAKDYMARAGTLTFPGPISNGTTQAISVPILDDALSENDETFTLKLSGPLQAHLRTAAHTVTILDGDPLPVIAIADASVKEPPPGRAALMNFTVSLSAVSGRTVSVRYATVDASARAGSDYTAKSGVLTLPAGTLSKLVPVVVRNNAARKGSDAFLVSLQSPVGAVFGRSLAQGTIVDSTAPAAACLPIVSLPYTITVSGSYCVQQNLETSLTDGSAITIEADSVVLDLQGFTLDGSGGGAGSQADGIRAEGRSNVTVRNGTVRGFYRGIVLEDGDPYPAMGGNRVDRVLSEASLYAGIWAQGRGAQVRRSRVNGTGGLNGAADVVGIFAGGPGARVLGNEVTDTRAAEGGRGSSVWLSGGDGAVVQGNRISNGGGSGMTAIDIAGSLDVLVVENRMTGTESGIVFDAGSTGKYRGNLTNAARTPYSGGEDAGGNQ
jgi:chitinase